MIVEVFSQTRSDNLLCPKQLMAVLASEDGCGVEDHWA